MKKLFVTIQHPLLVLPWTDRKLWREKIKIDNKLLSKYPTEMDVLEEMRSIRHIEYDGQLGYITPFLGAQYNLCKLFDIEIPKGCEPVSQNTRQKK